MLQNYINAAVGNVKQKLNARNIKTIERNIKTNERNIKTNERNKKGK